MRVEHTIKLTTILCAADYWIRYDLPSCKLLLLCALIHQGRKPWMIVNDNTLHSCYTICLRASVGCAHKCWNKCSSTTWAYTTLHRIISNITELVGVCHTWKLMGFLAFTTTYNYMCCFGALIMDLLIPRTLWHFLCNSIMKALRGVGLHSHNAHDFLVREHKYPHSACNIRCSTVLCFEGVMDTGYGYERSWTTCLQVWDASLHKQMDNHCVFSCFHTQVFFQGGYCWWV